MCHSDTSLTVFQWAEAKNKPMLSIRQPPYMCADWDQLVASVKDRVVSKEEMSRLKNPLNRDGVD